MSRPMRQNTPVPEDEQESEAEPNVVEPVVRDETPSPFEDDTDRLVEFLVDYAPNDFANSNVRTEPPPWCVGKVLGVPESREEKLREDAKYGLSKVFQCLGIPQVGEDVLDPGYMERQTHEEMVEQMLREDPPDTNYVWDD